MGQREIEGILSHSVHLTDPTLLKPNLPKSGGVDPLGLRMINFDLMDEVFPQINNVGRHIRPYVLVAWAWKRAGELAKQYAPKAIKPDMLRDFVDRIEVIYVWSQFSVDPNADLPGRDVIGSLLKSEGYTFGGNAWKARRQARRFSTALMAPVNYGPALKALRWIRASELSRDIMVPTEFVLPALNAFEAAISDRLDHPAFSSFEPANVTSSEVTGWAAAWDYRRPTEPEAAIARELIFGAQSLPKRKACAELMLLACSGTQSRDPAVIRAAMAGEAASFTPSMQSHGASLAWRRLQVRQLFRLCLESMFFWALGELMKRPHRSGELATSFLSQASLDGNLRTGEWLSLTQSKAGPVESLDRLTRANKGKDRGEVVRCVLQALRACLTETSEIVTGSNERADRLPLTVAKRQAAAWSDRAMLEFVQHVLERWVFAQHSYWSIGRGLADARAQGKTILRLRAVLDEGGWSLSPGAKPGSPPEATPDRLGTALILAREAGLLTPVS